MIQLKVAYNKPQAGPVEAASLQNDLTIVVNNYSKENIRFMAEMAAQPGANEKFDRLKNNPIVKALL